MFCLAVTSRCMVYHLGIGWLHVPTIPEPGRVISEGTIVVWTIFHHLTISRVSPGDQLLRWVLSLSARSRFSLRFLPGLWRLTAYY